MCRAAGLHLADTQGYQAVVEHFTKVKQKLRSKTPPIICLIHTSKQDKHAHMHTDTFGRLGGSNLHRHKGFLLARG